MTIDEVAEKTLAIDCPLVEVTGDFVATIGDNRKLLVFPLEQVPELTRGRGVRLQRFKDGGLSDIKTFAAADGLTWTDTAGRAIGDLLRAAGHEVAGRTIVRDDPELVRTTIERQLANPGVQVIILTGGTGITSRDSTDSGMPLLSAHSMNFS